MTDDAETLEALDPEKMKSEAEEVIHAITDIQEAKTEDEMLGLPAKKIGFWATLWEHIMNAGASLAPLVPTSGRSETGFQLAGIVLAAFDILLIPLGYLVNFIQGKKQPPLDLSTNARIGYSSVVLGLGIAAFVVPGLIPLMFSITGVLGAMAAAINLTRLFVGRDTLNDELNAVKAEIDKVRQIQKEAIQLKKEFDEASKEFDEAINDMSLSQEERKLKANRILLKANRALLNLQEKQFELDRLKPQELLNKEAKYVKELSILENPMVVLDRSAGMLAASVALVGAVCLFLFPPVGLAILAASGIFGAAYLLARIATPWIKRLADSVKAKPDTIQAQDVSKENEKEKPPQAQDTLNLDPHRSPEILLARSRSSSQSSIRITHFPLKNEEESVTESSTDEETPSLANVKESAPEGVPPVATKVDPAPNGTLSPTDAKKEDKDDNEGEGKGEGKGPN